MGLFNLLLLQVFYKEDLNWMKGVGCYSWDTPEIVRAKKSYELQSDVSSSYISWHFLKIYVCFFWLILFILNRSSTRQRARKSSITTLLWQTLLCTWLLYLATPGPVRYNPIQYTTIIVFFNNLKMFKYWYAVSFVLHFQLNYREAYHKEKHMYTTVLDTYDYARCFNLKQLYSTVSPKK